MFNTKQLKKGLIAMKQKIDCFLFALPCSSTGCSYLRQRDRYPCSRHQDVLYRCNAYAGLASKESSDLKFEENTGPDLPRICGLVRKLRLILESRRRIYSGLPTRETGSFS